MKAQFKLIGFFLALLAIFSVVCFGVVSLSGLAIKALLAGSYGSIFWGALAIPFIVQFFQWSALIVSEVKDLDLY